MFRKAATIFSLILLLSGFAYSQSPLDRIKRNIPKPRTNNNSTTSDYSQSPARSEIDGVRSILSNLRIRFKSQRWQDENWTREIGEYIRRADKYIVTIKEKDPGFNVSGFERDLQPYKSEYSSRGAALGAKDKYREMAREKNSHTNTFPQQVRISEQRDAESYFKAAQELDYPGTRKQLEEGVRQFPDLAEDSNVKDLLQQFPAEFQPLADGFISESNRFIELAYQTQSKNKTKAAEYAETATMLADLVLLIVPGHTQALAMKKDADAAMAKVGGALAASAYTSSFHKENAGKIVFFRTPTSIRQENPSAASTSFKSGENIYAILYLKGSMKELVSIPNRDHIRGLKYRVFIDGNEHQDFGGFPTGVTWEQYADPATTYLKLDVVPDPDAIDYPLPHPYTSPIKFARVFGQSSPRKHKIEIRLELNYKVAAEGSFELDGSAGHEKLLALADKLHQEMISKVFLPKPKMANAALQQSMMAALKSNGWKQQMLRAVITDSQWQIHRNALGAILFRSIGAAVAMKEPDGRCRFFTLSFKQQYQGGGYGRTEQYGVGDNFEMACANVNR